MQQIVTLDGFIIIIIIKITVNIHKSILWARGP